MSISSGSDDLTKLMADPDVVASRLSALKQAKDAADKAVSDAQLVGDIKRLHSEAAAVRQEATDYNAAKHREADSYFADARARADATKAEAARLIEAATRESTALAERSVADAQARAMVIEAAARNFMEKAEAAKTALENGSRALESRRVSAMDASNTKMQMAEELMAKAERKLAEAHGLKEDAERRIALIRAAGV